ncbi:HlyD family efflux transporter periplasmic adaptor subunit [Stieleria sp. TO1_6]|uniref:efflux RND transporter periplasmic adaptor subunit n=1 Tax=Stieleria tagensis TaxID=2956795 RepID=UPI00209AB9B0|nr:HlyD family efflux transporter periplasmic adaptor subunit [Stieleria tagensis]MCO8124323.1 HlyD family efflux transporter periplasmic adaptor subunit [Stieleria tagensis]
MIIATQSNPSGQPESSGTVSPAVVGDLTDRYLAILAQDQPLDSMHQRLAKLTCELLNARTVLWAPEPAHQAPSEDTNTDIAERLSDVAPDPRVDDEELAMVLTQVRQQSQPVVAPSQQIPQATNIGIPVSGHGVLLCRLVAGRNLLPSFVALLKMVAGYFVMAKVRHHQSQGMAMAADSQTRLQLIECLFGPGTTTECLQLWCTRVAAIAGATPALLCLQGRRRRKIRLVAQSGTDPVATDGETARLAKRLAAEVVLGGADLDQALSNQTTIKSKSATELASHLGVDQVFAFPLTEAQQTRGALILAGNALDAQRVKRARLAVAGSAPSLLFRHQPAVIKSAGETGHSSGWRRLVTAALSIAALVGLMWIPVPYHIRCPLTLTPQTRRFVAAPFDGILMTTDVAAGDVVHRGQPLGHLDDGPLKLELSRIATEQVRIRKQQEIHVAQAKIADAQLAELRLQELAASAELLQSKINLAVITSPLPGVVISQDLDDVENSSVSLGQPLFEVAPLAVLHAEIEVPEFHAQALKTGLLTSVWVNDGTGRRRQGKLERLAPRADVVGDRNIIRCEMPLDNDDQTLRPGMEGRAAIDVGQRTIGWILFHRLWDRLRVYVGI